MILEVKSLIALLSTTEIGDRAVAAELTLEAPTITRG
jgi:hypothetical protein